MLTIYGSLNSRAARNVWLADELRLEYEHIPVVQASRLSDPLSPNAPLNTDTPAFRKVNPAGLIPALDDGGLILTESLAINLHLARKYGGPLAPEDAVEDALMTQWTIWAATEIEPFAIEIIVNRQVRPKPNEDKAAVKAAISALEPRLRMLEAALADGKGHLVGGRFTVADLNVAEVIRYTQGAPELFRDLPALTQWLTACQTRPAFLAVAERRKSEPLPEDWREAYVKTARPGAPNIRPTDPEARS